MVDKIDKPEPPPAYFVQATTETKRDRGGSGGAEPQSDEYSGSHAAPGWQKLYASAANRRYLKLRREDIVRAWLRGTLMQRGISLAEVDLEIKDGRILKSAHVILSAREDFWTLKQFQPGQSIPLNMIARDPVVEISVPVQRPPVVPRAGEQIHASTTGGLNIKKIIIYSVIGVIGLLLIFFMATR